MLRRKLVKKVTLSCTESARVYTSKTLSGRPFGDCLIVAEASQSFF
jgi:hypothetical protein